MKRALNRSVYFSEDSRKSMRDGNVNVHSQYNMTHIKSVHATICINNWFRFVKTGNLEVNSFAYQKQPPEVFCKKGVLRKIHYPLWIQLNGNVKIG